MCFAPGVGLALLERGVWASVGWFHLLDQQLQCGQGRGGGVVWGTSRLDNCRVWGGGGIVAWGHGMVGFVCLIDHCSVGEVELWPGDRVDVALFVGSTVAVFGEEAGLCSV